MIQNWSIVAIMYINYTVPKEMFMNETFPSSFGNFSYILFPKTSMKTL
jgi:hypothetical protein